MFEKLIESRSEDAGFKNRKRYFMVSSVVVGILFSAAVVVSIFAAEYGLGSDEFDLVALTAPPEIAPVEPEPPRPAAAQSSQDQTPTIRTANIQRIDEPPVAVPENISVTPNTEPSRPLGSFTLGPTNTVTGQPSGREGSIGDDTGGLAETTGPPTEESKPIPVPPPVVPKPDPPKPKGPISGGVVNGKATHLPVPVYPAMARANNITGQVEVQVTIDEEGRVISASAVRGHVMLRAEAEKAARRARFGTTYLTNVPVKVTGVIIYNFKR